jgi:hypothetical protein
MKNAARCVLVMLGSGLALVVGCDKSERPAVAARAEPADAPATPASSPTSPTSALVMPDACALLDAREVATAVGWKSAKTVQVHTGAEYLAACDFVDAADPTRVVKVNVAFGALVPEDSVSYAALVGDREGTLEKPATPVTHFDVPVIEMDGGPGAHSMQTRFEPTTELTVTTPTLQMTRVLFPRALIKLRQLPELQKRNDS